MCAAVAVSGAWAADVATKAPSKAAAAESRSPWMIRARALWVRPDASGEIDQIAGSDLDIDSSVVPELDISYFVTPNIALELVLGVTPHDISGAGTISGVDVGKAWLLPPTLTLQYHFTDFGAFKPYVGAGPNYTVFFNQDAAGGVVTALDLENSFGFALQAGFDFMIDRHWGFNVDVKKIYLRPDLTATIGGVPMTGNAKIDPLLVGTGVVYRF
jgi:outer membrane protein